MQENVLPLILEFENAKKIQVALVLKEFFI
jgi:hypothetical protein